MKQSEHLQHSRGSTPELRLHRVVRILFLIGLIEVGSIHAAPTLEIGNASGAPGSTVKVPLVIRGGGTVVAAQFDLQFTSANLRAEAALLGDELSKFTVISREVRPGLQRLVLYSRAGLPLPDPAQLSVPFEVTDGAPSGTVPVSLSNLILADQGARAIIPASVMPGSVSVSASPGIQFQSVLLGAGGVLQLQFTATPGKSYVLQTSTDLRLWLSLSTNVASGGIVTVTDRVKSGQLFYRAATFP